MIASNMASVISKRVFAYVTQVLVDLTARLWRSMKLTKTQRSWRFNIHHQSQHIGVDEQAEESAQGEDEGGDGDGGGDQALLLHQTSVDVQDFLEPEPDGTL